MKKIIAVILTITMLFSLTACGGDTLVGPSISYTVKGQGKKELKISVTDKFEQEYTLDYTLCDDDAKFFEAVITNDSDHSHEYKITPLAVGNHSFGIRFLSGEELLGAVSLNVIVKEDGKIYYSDMSFNDPTAQYDALEEGVQITIQEGGAQIIQLSNADGEWEIDQYDDAIVSVDGPELLENKTISSFTIGAVGEGSTSVYLINDEANMQMILNFTSTKATDEVSADEYILQFIDYVTSELTKTSDPVAAANYTAAQQVVAEAADGEITSLNLPDDVVITEAVYFDRSKNKDSDTGKDDGTDTVDKNQISSDISADDNYKEYILCEVSMEYNGYKMDLQQSDILTAADYTKAVSGDVVAKEEKSMKVGNLNIKYYYLSGGTAIAIWEESGIASRLTFTDGAHTSKEYQDMITTLLTAEVF